ncbi:MAG TPA: RNA polymerase sigma factor [Thermoleophilaceae bacterium]|nr:RNA polymerase sigma factor [Thermoleophilaceae bacterium]
MSAVAGRKPIHVGALSDDDLVRLARMGDEDAFDVIVHRYRGPLVGYCRRWLDAGRAEEVVQHALMKAFLAIRDDDRPLVLRPWLYRVAHNAALNAVEKKGSEWEELDENYDGVPQPPHVAEQRARFRTVMDEISALPARQREALLLNEFEGRCYADIAARLGTSESGVRGLLRRARHQIRSAAALLLPFPALRELARSGDGRGFDRAGELIGTAGAAGGMGAAGGLATKVAAGVLAAGTLAGGGTALERSIDAARAPDARAAETPAAKAAGGGAATDALVDASATHAGPFVGERITAGGKQLAAGVRLPGRRESLAGDGDSFAGIPPAAPPAEPDPVAPGPVVEVPPTVPLEPAPEDEPGTEEPASGEIEEEPAEEPPPSEEEGEDESPEGGVAQPVPDERTGSDPDPAPGDPLPLI